MRLKLKQIERRRKNMVERFIILQLSWIHNPLRVNLAPILAQFFHNRRIKVLQLGHPYTVLPRHHPAERNHFFHNIVDNLVSPVEHRPIIRKDRYIDMDIAVTGMHMRRQHYAPVADIRKCVFQGRLHLGIPLHQLTKLTTQLLHNLK